MKPIPPISAARLKIGAAFRRLATGLEFGEIEHPVVDVIEALIPLAQGLAVDRADAPMAAPAQLADQVSADEPSGPGD
jgi:hypothetical protein